MCPELHFKLVLDTTILFWHVKNMTLLPKINILLILNVRLFNLLNITLKLVKVIFKIAVHNL